MNNTIDVDVAIIGAGIAGITAANYLLNNNKKVALIEAKDCLGGRASSIYDSTSKSYLDNGQHLLMGAYSEFLKLLDNLDTSKHLKTYFNLDISIYSSENNYILKSNKIGKLALISSIFNLEKIDLIDKIRIINLFSILNFISPNNWENKTCIEFLKYYKQSEIIIKIFWEPLILATLNSISSTAPANLLITVMKKAFLSDTKNSQMILSTIDFSKLFDPIKSKFNNNSYLLYNTFVNEILIENKKVTEIRTKNETIIKSKYYISTLQPFQLKKIIPPNIELSKTLNIFDYSPIITIYLWFEDPIISKDFVAFVDSRIHWVFDRSKFINSDSDTHNEPLAIVISSANELIDMPLEQILRITLEELEIKMPKFKTNKLLHSKIFKEKFATTKFNTINEQQRPYNITEFENLYIAGDWTQTDLPATLESAAVSGKNSAELILNKL